MSDVHTNGDAVPLTAADAPPMVSGRQRRWLTVGLLLLLAAGGAAAGGGVLAGVIPNPFGHHPPVAAAATADARAPLAKVIRPKRADSVPILVEQLAMVEPYFRADLRARASGLVKRVSKDIGEKVKRGEVLVEIDVPELEQDVARTAATVLQREQELKVSVAKMKDAKAAVKVSAATIKQRDADVEGAVATRDLRKGRFERFKDLAKRDTVVGSAVFEEERDYLVSESAVAAAKANVERARADFAESESKVEAAEADIELKRAQIEVAKKDLDRAKAVADYARVLAPFDGVVTSRAVDPGSFVQNATTGASEVLISIARVDVVTVAARFPDSVAPLVGPSTEAVVEIDDLPGVTIASQITRFAPTVQNADRTMRVEVDLFNGTADEYRQLERERKAGGVIGATKGATDPMPVRAFPHGVPSSGRLIPGMTATMKLAVGGFGESFVLPSTAVYSRSGTYYILLVENGKTKQVPVKRQVNDGKTVRVAILGTRKDADGKVREVLSDLTGREEVVAARQLELGDGAAVKAGESEW